MLPHFTGAYGGNLSVLLKIIEKAFLRVGVGWCAATGQREDSALALSCGTELTAQVGYVYANDGHRGGHRLRDGEVASCLRAHEECESSDLLLGLLDHSRLSVAHDAGVGCSVAAGALASRGEGLVAVDLDERRRVCADDVYLAPLSRAVTPEREAPCIRMRRIRLGKLKPIVQWDYVGTYAIHQPQVDDSCASNNVVDNVRIPDLTVASSHVRHFLLLLDNQHCVSRSAYILMVHETQRLDKGGRDEIHVRHGFLHQEGLHPRGGLHDVGGGQSYG